MWPTELLLFFVGFPKAAVGSTSASSVPHSEAQMTFRWRLWTLRPRVSVASPSARQIMNVAVKNWLTPNPLLCFFLKQLQLILHLSSQVHGMFFLKRMIFLITRLKISLTLRVNLGMKIAWKRQVEERGATESYLGLIKRWRGRVCIGVWDLHRHGESEWRKVQVCSAIWSLFSGCFEYGHDSETLPSSLVRM